MSCQGTVTTLPGMSCKWRRADRTGAGWTVPRVPSAPRLRGLLARWWVPAVLLVVPFAIGVAMYGSYVCDDDLIHLRYAERLVEGKGLTWNDGERVHGISAMLMVLATAALHLAGVPLEAGMRVLSASGTFAAVLCVVYASRRAGLHRNVSAALGGVLALFAPFSVWAMAGIGGAVFAACIGWAVVLVTEPRTGGGSWLDDRFRRLVVTALLCLVQLVRPDAPLMVASVFVLMLADPGTRRLWRRFLRLTVLPVMSTGLVYAGLQFWYFASPVPHMTGVKFSFDPDLVGIGLEYLLEFLRGFFPLLLAAPLLLVSAARRTTAVLGPLLPAVVWVLYLVWIGGDWTPGNRHFALVLVLVMVSAVRAVAASSYRRDLSVGVLLAAVVLAAGVSSTAPAARRALDAAEWLEVTCEGSEDVGRMLGHLDPLLGVEPGGCPPYVTGMQGLDLLGLTDLHVSRALPTGRPVSWAEWLRLQSESPEELPGVFIPGHGNGDGTYVWNREPDLLVGCNPPGASATGCFRSFFEMQERFDFASRYRPLVLVLDSGTLWHAWVRFDAGPLGVQSDYADGALVSVDVPAWLLTDSPDAPLRVLDSASGTPAEGRVRLASSASLETPPVSLTAGEWLVEGLPASVEVVSLSTCATTSRERLVVTTPECEVTLRVSAASPAEVGPLSFTSVSS